MVLNIAITASFINNSETPIRENYLINYFKELTTRKNYLRFYILNWWSIESNGTAEVYDILNNKIIKEFQITLFNLIHVFRLGYPPKKELPLKDKWNIFKSKLDILSSAKVRCVNPIETLHYQTNKEYLLYLHRIKFPIIPSVKVPSSISYKELIKEYKNYFEIVKPYNGECGKLVNKISNLIPKDLDEYRIQSTHILLQPFIPEIQYGEISIVYAQGEVFSAAIKTPKRGGFKTNGAHVEATSKKYSPSSKEINLGLKLLDVFPKKLEIFRLDYVISNSKPLVMEIEVIDPHYYVPFNQTSADKLSRFYVKFLNNGNST